MSGQQRQSPWEYDARTYGQPPKPGRQIARQHARGRRLHGIGSADNELGHNLINMYFYTLTQMDTPPSVIAFMNEGVMLPCENQQIVESLKTLMEKGTRVMVCGTCLNFFGITDKLQCGTVSNMYEILEAVTACGKMMRV